MKHHLYADSDYKAAPEHGDFEKQHALRRELINTFVDGVTGGVTSSRSDTARARDIPHGGLFRTCNYEHASYSIRHGEAMIEARSCSFVWPSGVKGNDEASRYIDKHRTSIYAIGQGFRKWVMSRYAEDKARFRAEMEELEALARVLVNAYDAWEYDQHRNHAEVMIFGLLVWQQFIEQELPGYFLYQWIEERIPLLIEERIARSAMIKHMIEEYQERITPETFVLGALRYLLNAHAVYIRSQQDKPLNEVDIEGLPFSLEDVGYRSVTRNGAEEYEPGNRKIGYLVHKGGDIAFIPGLLMEELSREAGKPDKKVPLGSKRDIEEALLKAGVLLPQVDKDGKFLQHERLVTIAGRERSRFIVIPVPVLFADNNVLDELEEPEEEEEQEPGNEQELPANITYARDKFRSRSLRDEVSIPAFDILPDEVEEITLSPEEINAF